jgi:hypothetical protein
MRIALALSLALAPIAAPAPVSAQRPSLIIFGDDKCPADEICVVAPESERYRIPAPFRERLKSPDSQSWAVRSQATMAEGKTGADSCSAVGPGGWTGCFMEQMRKAREENKAREAGQTVP